MLQWCGCVCVCMCVSLYMLVCVCACVCVLVTCLCEDLQKHVYDVIFLGAGDVQSVVQSRPASVVTDTHIPSGQKVLFFKYGFMYPLFCKRAFTKGKK